MSIRISILIPVFACCAYSAMAGSLIIDQDAVNQANEVAAPSENGTATGRASSADNRDRARNYQMENNAAGTDLIIMQEDDNGMLEPRSGSRLPENRAKAQSYQRDSSGASPAPILVVPARRSDAADELELTREKLDQNQAIARKNMRGEAALTGTDKLPVVSCVDTGNVSGRIGDDTMSGNVITLMQNGKKVRAICK